MDALEAQRIDAVIADLQVHANAVKYLAYAYVCLLKMPHGVERAESQAAFAAVRDALAHQLNFDAEQTQNMFELQASRPLPPLE